MRAKEGDSFWDTSGCIDRFERVNLKTYLDLLPHLSPIPKSAYGCCQYYTVIESFTETDQANVYQEIPFNPQIQPACFSSWDPGQRISGEDCLSSWSIHSMVRTPRLFWGEIVQPPTSRPSCPLTRPAGHGKILTMSLEKVLSFQCSAIPVFNTDLQTQMVKTKRTRDLLFSRLFVPVPGDYICARFHIYIWHIYTLYNH